MTTDCHFCKILAHLDQHPDGEMVWQFPHSVALLGPYQYYHGYCLLVSRVHARELFELSDEVRRGYLDEMCLLARAINRAFSPHKLNYELLGNQVPHLHWHLFPRSRDDPHHLQPVWLALDAEERKQQLQTGPMARAATVAELRRVLTSLRASGS
jgi:diadenosine tetraphosphate (Ap4A) HIT family hydrolase